MRNLKKVIALVAVFAMLVSTVAFAQTFSDVDAEHDYYEAIEMLSNLNILTGDDADGDGTMDFRAEDKITRAEVATIISRIQGINSAAQVATEFVDVPSTHWASGYVAQAAGQGIVNGYGDGNFGPEDNVLYEQAIKMLVVTLGYTPFVEANGGYPAGHLMAATRYGIVDGVIGASVGVEATRGQIAQLVYNAIDTPLMDSATYGANAEYVIYDDDPDTGDYPFTTLLTRDLGVKKFTGVVTVNEVSSFTAAVDIDTEEDAVVTVASDDSKTNANYEFDEIKTLYAGESGIGALLGKHVTGYAVEDGKNGKYLVLTAAETATNDVEASFSIDAFVSVDSDSINYLKNSSDKKATEVEIDIDASNVAVILNGVVAKYDDVFDVDGDGGEPVRKNSPVSGTVEIVTNGGYETSGTAVDTIVYVNIGVPALVDEVYENGDVVFKNIPEVLGEAVELSFDEDITSQIIELTKDGAAIEWTELAADDVLSIFWNPAGEYYVVEVVEGGKVEGTISQVAKSSTSNDGYKYTVDSKTYDVAEGFYGNGTLKAGASGVFYIDGFGKLIAYDKNGATSASDGYAYIIKASAGTDGWNDNVKVQLLDKSGEVYTAYLADKVTLENTTSAIRTAAGITEDGSATLANFKDYNDFAELLANQVVTYAANSAGEIKEITFAKAGEDENTLSLYAAGSASFDEEDREATINGKKVAIDDDTIVFFIKGSSEISAIGDDTNFANVSYSKVATGAAVNDITTYAAVYDVNDDYASVLVVLNATGGMSSSAPLAVISSIGKASVDGDTTYAITYWMNGVEATSYIAEDCIGFNSTAIAADMADGGYVGDLYKLALSADGTLITEMAKYADAPAMSDAVADAATAWGFEDLGVATGLEAIVWGPVVERSASSDMIKVAQKTEGVFDYDNPAKIKNVSDANVYVVDVFAKNEITAGTIGSAYVNTRLLDKDDDGSAYTQVDIDKDGVVDVAKGVKALGMLDYAVAYTYDDDAVDVVIYKAYEFEYKLVK